MILFKTVSDYRAWHAEQRRAGRNIGFAPTMGALHEGHLELLHMAQRAGDVPVASIFVNPTQFNDPKDLEKYPRTPGRDMELLLSAGCEALFMPEVNEVYPPGQDLTLHLDFGQLDKVMEGAFRPGHFAGMATVVNRLINIIGPQRLYMGQKDFQQLTIVRDMLRQLQSPVELVMCPTVREPDGLAMSSRNMRLSPEMRQIAPVIYQILLEAKAAFQHRPAAQVQAHAMAALSAAGLKPEYFELAEGYTLQPVGQWSDAEFVVACTAAWAGEVRLIDNLVLKAPEDKT
ncbi:MAG: pantoate--beta-alanine ligase [Saprospiraceae bacterium]|nr:pantoate--beta-alanine ligase [Saprospiraceae bacterium]